MDRNKSFLKNTIIIFIGKFSTQFMSLLLIPLFTHYLSTNDYGVVDLLQTYIALLIPVLSLRIDSAIFRFLIDKRDNEKSQILLITNTIVIMMLGIIITIVGGFIVFKFVTIQYFLHVILNLVILIISSVFLQILRGLGKNKEYSIVSIIVGVSNLIINVVLIISLNVGAESILISSTVSNILGITYVIIDTKLWKKIKLDKLSFKESKKLLAFSIPMIPDYLSGWIINVSDRTIIAIVLGAAMNGIYTVSSKFSNILNSIFSIYNMSWQETAVLHINDPDRDEFFTGVFNKSIMVFSAIGLLMLSVLPFVYNIIIGIDYLNSYEYIPILIYANTWRVIVGLTMGIYIAKNKTKEVAITTVVSAIINIIINIALVASLGVYAACISTLIAYMIMAIYRFIDCKKYVKVQLDVKKILIFTIIFISSSVSYRINNFILNSMNLIIVFIYTSITNKDLIKSGIKILRNKIKKSDNKIDESKKVISNKILHNNEFILKTISENNDSIKYIDFSLVNYDIVDTIVNEIKKYNFIFNNNDFLRNGYYPKQLANNYKFMKYVIDKDFNNLAYVDTDNINDENLENVIDYAFKKVYYMKKEDSSVQFDLDGVFKNKKIIKNPYFNECLTYLNKMEKAK